MAEDAGESRREGAFTGAGQFRRLGDAGPTYAVNGDEATGRMVDTDETFESPRAEAGLDVLA